MSFFDRVNPFKKKDDLGLPPLDEQFPPLDNNIPATPPDYGQALGSMGQPHEPSHMIGQPQTGEIVQDDHRMRMPLGESVRQGRIAAMHESSEYAPVESHNPLRKDLELISSKLDYLKASLDAVNQRLIHIEHITKEDIQKRKW